MNSKSTKNMPNNNKQRPDCAMADAIRQNDNEVNETPRSIASRRHHSVRKRPKER